MSNHLEFSVIHTPFFIPKEDIVHASSLGYSQFPSMFFFLRLFSLLASNKTLSLIQLKPFQYNTTLFARLFHKVSILIVFYLHLRIRFMVYKQFLSYKFVYRSTTMPKDAFKVLPTKKWWHLKSRLFRKIILPNKFPVYHLALFLYNLTLSLCNISCLVLSSRCFDNIRFLNVQEKIAEFLN